MWKCEKNLLLFSTQYPNYNVSYYSLCHCYQQRGISHISQSLSVDSNQSEMTKSKGQRFPFINCHLKTGAKWILETAYSASLQLRWQQYDHLWTSDRCSSVISSDSSVRLYSPKPPETLLTVVTVFILTIELIWKQKNIYMDIQWVCSRRKLFF